MEFRSPKYWAELRAKYKDEDLPPLEIVPLSEQNKEYKSLRKEDKLLRLKNKHFNKGEK